MEEQQKQLLKEAANEIRHLRQINAVQAAKLEVFDGMMALLNASRPAQSGCMSPDICWQIDKLLETT